MITRTVREANAETSYLTWVDSLHPETHALDVSLVDEDSPLWSVYEGAIHDLPIATAVPANLNNHEGNSGTIEEGNAGPGNNAVALAATTTKGGETSSMPKSDDIEIPSSDEPWGDENKKTESSRGLDLVMGCILSFVAISYVSLMELVGYALYMISVGSYQLSQSLSPPNIFTGLFYSIFHLIYWVLALVDSILLLVSVLVAEVVAAISYVMSCLLGGSCNIARRWHQYSRKTCHRIRWAFRCRLAYEDPPRHFFISFQKNGDQEEVDFEKPDAVEVEPSKEHRLKQGSVSTSATAVPSTSFGDKEDAIVVLG